MVISPPVLPRDVNRRYLMSGGHQQGLQPRNHGVTRMEEVINLYTVRPLRLGLASSLPVCQDNWKRTAKQEEVAHVKVEVGVSSLVIVDGEVSRGCLCPPAGALPDQPRPLASLGLLLALTGVHPGLAGLPT